MNSILSALSLCRKAGALVTGFDAVKESVLRGKARMVMIASDLSPKTAQRVQYFCEEMIEVDVIPLTIEELGEVTAKPTGVFAVTDPQLSKLCRNKLTSKGGIA